MILVRCLLYGVLASVVILNMCSSHILSLSIVVECSKIAYRLHAIGLLRRLKMIWGEFLVLHY